MNNNKVQFSKKIAVVTTILFIFTLLLSYFCPAADPAYNIAAIGVAGSIQLTTFVWYLKKSQAENIVKLQTAYVKELSEIRFEYNKKMADLGLTDDRFDSICDDAEMSGMERLNDRADDAMSDIEIQRVEI